MRTAGLAQRSLVPERMDTERVGRDDLARALADLEWLGAVGLAHRPLLGWLDRLARRRRALGHADELSVLDVGCGGGGMLRRIAVWGRRRGLKLRLLGVDINPLALVVAEAATAPELGIRFEVGDARALGPTLSPDVIVSTHFAHHLSDPELAAFLAWMARTARVGWFVNDLHRHWLPLWSLHAGVRALRCHRFVVSDATASIRRAFVRSDWEAALRAAGIPRAAVEVRWYAPFRWGVGSRPDG